MRVLLVEDEKDLARSITDYLIKNEKICVDVANNFNKASELCELYEYECFIIDIGLPDGSGLDLIKIIKTNDKKAGIIIISARNSLDDRIAGLDLGADDYLVKPFHLSELKARIHSLVRRLRFDGDSVFVLNEISLDSQCREVRINDVALDLTKSEYNLLVYLLTNKNQVISKTSIAEHLVC